MGKFSRKKDRQLDRREKIAEREREKWGEGVKLSGVFKVRRRLMAR